MAYIRTGEYVNNPFPRTSLVSVPSVIHDGYHIACTACKYQETVYNFELFTMCGDYSTFALEIARKHSHTKESIEKERKIKRQKFLKSRRYQNV